jgi:ATP-dependent DNA helicase DinG
MDVREEVKNFFSETGLLANKYDNYEYRESQIEMAFAILDTLQGRSHLFVEAPTGVGKSFAYLVPAIYFAKENNKKAVVSTHTINLQEQLIGKDIPFLQEILPIDFQAVLLKGKSNYVCPKRLRRVLESSNSLFESDEQLFLEKISLWAKDTQDGTLSDISFQVNSNVWSSICAERGVCSNKTCGGEDTECFYQKARFKIADSDVVIVNHHLFFTLYDGVINEEADGYLYRNDFVIFDEAQTVENVAAAHVIPELSREMIKFHLKRLYNDKKKKGFLTNFDSLHIIPIIQNLLEINQHFFQELKRQLFIMSEGRLERLTVRVHEKGKKSNEDENGNFVYWVEISSQKEDANISICSNPIDISDYFRKNIFRENNSSVFTSATLTVNNNFEFYKRRLGAEAAEEIQLPSPFEFYKQVKIFIPKDIPEPKRQNSEEYKGKLVDWISYFVEFTNGKALVLFTNSSLMKETGNNLREFFSERNIDVLIQGEGLSRKNLLESFKNNVNSVLFGLDSFWLGVDVPGEALSNLIITRLPFQVPDHPLIQARLEMIDAKGGNSFMDYSLPEAILKFRQGVGRLIRSSDDKGIVVILDNRVIMKPYGKHFISSIDECEIDVIEDTNY